MATSAAISGLLAEFEADLGHESTSGCNMIQPRGLLCRRKNSNPTPDSQLERWRGYATPVVLYLDLQNEIAEFAISAISFCKSRLRPQVLSNRPIARVVSRECRCATPSRVWDRASGSCSAQTSIHVRNQHRIQRADRLEPLRSPWSACDRSTLPLSTPLDL